MLPLRIIFFIMVIFWIIVALVPWLREIALGLYYSELYFFLLLFLFIVPIILSNVIVNVLALILGFLYLFILIIKKIFGLSIDDETEIKQNSNGANNQSTDRETSQKSNSYQQKSYGSNNSKFNFGTKTNEANNFLTKIIENESNVKMQFECIANIVGAALNQSINSDRRFFPLALQVLNADFKGYYNHIFADEYKRVLAGYQESRIKDCFIDGLNGINLKFNENPFIKLNKLVKSPSFIGDKQILALIIVSSYYVVNRKSCYVFENLVYNIVNYLDLNEREQDTLADNFVKRKEYLQKINVNFRNENGFY
ncbi:hypothetical protein CKF59_07665 [Psittacicella gerlachiana]|uniref:Uncharacterized protein n=2 Tax=Psittacicella gerlachiana TaxID=2028574 RepID=A0A3A1Y5G1_9GAMM|nr:hypothetical protein CKF59_07665 [Psittacicella gerlachiana]